MAGITELLAQIDDLKRQLDALRPLDREVEERILQKFRLWWTYHSNAIEGNKLSQGETEMFLMEGLTAKGKPLKDHLDLQGHSNAVNYLLGFVRDKGVLTEADIRKLHEVLLVEAYSVPAITPDGQDTRKRVTLGEYKTQPNHVRTVTGEMHYYATPMETPARMQALVDWQRSELAKGTHPVEIAARFHHEFTAIHPFDDGNGRMARLLMNLLLLQAGYPPVVIRLGERDAYLSALRQADRGDFDALLELVGQHVADSLDLYLRGVQGEEIHEPTDLQKEIALLKIQLQHVEEPLPLSLEVQKRIFENSIVPLMGEIKLQITPLIELFSESSVQQLMRHGEASASRPIGEKDFSKFDFRVLADGWKNANFFIYQLEFVFKLNGFRKARLDGFDVSTSLRMEFEPLKYLIEANGVTPSLSIKRLYQEQLTRDEITAISQGIARYFLEVIKKKTSAQS